MFTAFAPTTNFGSIFPPTPSFPLNLLFPTPFLTAIQQHNEELFLKKRKRLLSKSPLPPTKRYADAQAAESPECSASSLAALEKLSQDVTPSPVDRILDCEARRIPSKVALTSRNRYGRPYISGRPLLTCDRLKIVECFRKGMKKIHIAKQLGITHSCVSKVLRRYAETGEVGARACRTASCSCPGSAESHDRRFCRHLQDNIQRRLYSIENLLMPQTSTVIYYSKIFEISE